jgi:integrase
MRAGELCAIRWPDVKADHVVLHVSKTGAGRHVPVSAVGLRILKRMKGWDSETVFGLKPQTLDANFRKYRDRAGLKGFTFHDSRHTAATRVALLPNMTLLMLCKIFGWKNPKQAMTYFNPTTRQMAALL